MSKRTSKQTDAEKVMPILVPVLGHDLAAAIIELRDNVVRVPLTEYAAKLQVLEYLATGNPIAAAEMQILRSWRALKSDWYLNEVKKQERASPKRSNDMAEFTKEVMEKYNERTLPPARH